MTPVLQCSDLTKSYKSGTPVLNGLNLMLPAGKIVGLLGPNGCGKSTLLKLIAGILTPDCGSIQICGLARSDATNSLVAYLPERTYFTPSMSVESNICYFRDFYADFDEECARRMIADMGIDTSAKLRQLSKGSQEKVQLILVMSRKARLFLLDEPIAGVDPVAREYILKTIIGNYNEDATVLISTHLIRDIEPILEEFFFMGYGGEILLSGETDAVREEHGGSLEELFKEVFGCCEGC